MIEQTFKSGRPLLGILIMAKLLPRVVTIRAKRKSTMETTADMRNRRVVSEFLSSLTIYETISRYMPFYCELLDRRSPESIACRELKGHDDFCYLTRKEEFFR